MDNIILDTDSYKASHYLQYPPGSKYMFDYLESRGGKYDFTLFFGLQYILKKYLSQPITTEMVEEAAEFFNAHGEPFPYNQWMYVAKNLGGRLPVLIKAVPEGSVVPTHNVLMTVESTDPKVFWIVSWLETQLLRVWYPTTVATQSFSIKRRIMEFLNRTSDTAIAEIPFKLHDFGSRGVSSSESAAIGGAAHLVNFMGSDTVAGVWAAKKYYGCNMAGYSIPAAEHSTITSWGREHELDAYRNMLNHFDKPGKIVAVVSDSYNIYNACEHLWGESLYDKIVNSGGTVVIRPDSGDPATVVVRVLDILTAKFGFTTNSKNYKVLPPYIRIIQGDGVNEDSILDILVNCTKNNYSTSNIAFGMGGALLQQVNRDTQRFAIKCSAVMVGEQLRNVQKNPATDPTKASKAGLLTLVREGNKFATVARTAEVAGKEALQAVYENGTLLVEDSLDTIRGRAAEYLNVQF